MDESKFEAYKDEGEVVYFAKDWMRSLSDSLLLTEITYPASHDTAAGPEDYFDIAHRVQTQEWVITDQLNAGIRAFDIRLTPTRDGTKLNLHHGIIYLDEDWATLLTGVQTFLTEHPSEALLMTIQQEERGCDNYCDLVFQYVNEFSSIFFSSDSNEVPTLAQTRGKVWLSDNNNYCKSSYFSNITYNITGTYALRDLSN